MTNIMAKLNNEERVYFICIESTRLLLPNNQKKLISKGKLYYLHMQNKVCSVHIEGDIRAVASLIDVNMAMNLMEKGDIVFVERDEVIWHELHLMEFLYKAFFQDLDKVYKQVSYPTDEPVSEQAIIIEEKKEPVTTLVNETVTVLVPLSATDSYMLEICLMDMWGESEYFEHWKVHVDLADYEIYHN